MKQFWKALYKSIILLTLTAISFTAILALSSREPFRTFFAEITNSNGCISGYNQGASEIIPYIKKVQKKDHYTKLLVGDSVCFRIFSELQDINPDYCIAGTNRGVTMSGQYILVKLFLDNHPEATDVYLAVIEDSLITTYETGYGYQYAVMPFAETDTLSMLDPITIQQMKHTYGSLFIHKKVVNLIEDSPLNKKLYYNLLNDMNPTYSKYSIPDVSSRYILKIQNLCIERGVNFYLIPEPLMDTKERHEIEIPIREAYKNSPLYQYFPAYFNQLFYYPKENFAENVHITGTRDELNDVIRTMQEKTGVMKDLVLEP